MCVVPPSLSRSKFQPVPVNVSRVCVAGREVRATSAGNALETRATRQILIRAEIREPVLGAPLEPASRDTPVAI